MQRSPIALWPLFVAAWMFPWTVPVHAQPVTFRKVADTNTPIPGGTGNFTRFTGTEFPFLKVPSIDGSNVTFIGTGAGGQIGVYAEIGGNLQVVADTNTPIPGGTGNFTDFPSFSVSIAGGSVAFVGTAASGRTGIYTNLGGTLKVVADTHTPIPGGTGNFALLDFASTDGQDVAFLGRDSASTAGVYVDRNGTFRVVADANTVVPGGQVNFFNFHGASMDGGDIVFLGSATGLLGFFAEIGGTLVSVADSNTPIPGGTGNFDAFFIYGSIGNGSVAFQAGQLFEEKHGIYTNVGGPLRVVADLNTPIPGGDGNFVGFFGSLGPSIDNGNVAFSGTGTVFQGSNQGGIYAEYSGFLIKVLDLNDTLDGKTLLSLETPLGADSLSGNQIAFSVLFADGSQGVFVAAVNSVCGDGVLDNAEQCDDGNTINGDGCSASCQTEQQVIPTVSTWGLAILTLSLLAVAKISFGRRFFAQT